MFGVRGHLFLLAASNTIAAIAAAAAGTTAPLETYTTRRDLDPVRTTVSLQLAKQRAFTSQLLEHWAARQKSVLCHAAREAQHHRLRVGDCPPMQRYKAAAQAKAAAEQAMTEALQILPPRMSPREPAELAAAITGDKPVAACLGRSTLRAQINSGKATIHGAYWNYFVDACKGTVKYMVHPSIRMYVALTKTSPPNIGLLNFTE